jgi:hypothetical protein
MCSCIRQVAKIIIFLLNVFFTKKIIFNMNFAKGKKIKNNVEWVCSFGYVFLELVAKLISFSYSIVKMFY